MTVWNDKLETLARARFSAPSLSLAEVKLVRTAPIGEATDCGPRSTRLGVKDLKATRQADSQHRVRADLLRWLCVDPQAAGLVDPGGIQLWNATIEGLLDLSFAKVPFPLAIVACDITDDIVLRQAEIPDLILTIHLSQL